MGALGAGATARGLGGGPSQRTGKGKCAFNSNFVTASLKNWAKETLSDINKFGLR